MSSTRSSKSTPTLGVGKKSQLIECVKVRPCLWDHHCEAFKSSGARQSAFNEIVNELSDGHNQYTRTQVQEEWGKIRYCFTRIMKKFLTANDDTEAVSWPHWNDMRFMYNTIKEHLLTTGLASAVGHSAKRYRKYSTAFNLIQKSNLIDGMTKDPVMVSNSVLSVLKTKNLRKRKHNRDIQNFNSHRNLQLDQSVKDLSRSSSPLNRSPNLITTPTSSISSAAAKVLFDLGLNPSLTGATENGFVKSEQFPSFDSNSNCSNGDTTNDDSYLLSSEKSLQSNSENNWENFLTTGNFSSANNTLNALTFSLNNSNGNSSKINSGKQSPILSQLPNTSSMAVAVNNVLNNCNEFRSGLPSVESNDGDLKSCDEASKETNEFFGKYMVQQMQAVSKKNPTLGVLLRKELMEVCCKYELQAFT